MKIEIWPDDTSMPEMNDWLAELRDDGAAAAPAAEPDAAGPAASPGGGAASGGGPAPAALAAPAGGRAGPAAPAAFATPADPADPAGEAGPAEAAVRAVIGDQLRMPIMWCEMGSCISRYADPAALGEGDSRARAIGAGWRIDAFGRLACPRCQQTDPGFRASRPVVPWDRYTAIARAAQVAAMRGEPMAAPRVR